MVLNVIYVGLGHTAPLNANIRWWYLMKVGSGNNPNFTKIDDGQLLTRVFYIILR